MLEPLVKSGDIMLSLPGMEILRYKNIHPDLHALGFYGSKCQGCTLIETESNFSIAPKWVRISRGTRVSFALMAGGRNNITAEQCPRGRECFPIADDRRPGELRVAEGPIPPELDGALMLINCPKIVGIF